MGEYDEGEMKVLNDDIDALLIFVSNCCPTSLATNRPSKGRFVLRCTDSICRPVLPVAPDRQQPALRPTPGPDLCTTRLLRDRPSLHKLHSVRHISLFRVLGLHLGKVDELPVVHQSHPQSVLGAFWDFRKAVDSVMVALGRLGEKHTSVR